MSSAYYTRSKAVAEHRAAGVLPFALHDGALMVLLGAEPCRTGPGGKFYRSMWKDFGGGRESVDADSVATAAREFAEETLGLFGAVGVDAAAVAAAAAAAEVRLRDPKLSLKVVHPLKKGSYHLYLTQQPFVSPLMFRLATVQNGATRAVEGAEKTAFAWVPFKELLACTAQPAPRYWLVCAAHVCGGEGTPQPSARGGQRRFQLHPCFASSLREAQRCGLDALLASATELPLPPPPPLPPLLVAPAPMPHPAAAALDAMAVAAAVEIAAAVAAEASDDNEEASEGAVVDMGCGYWLQQAGIADALRDSVPAGEAAHLPSGLLLPALQQQQQQQQQRSQQTAAPASSSQQHPPSPAAAAAMGQWGRAARTPGAAAPPPAGTPAASGSSLARPSSSLDTASSLRASRQAATAAAVDDVRQQIEVNSSSTPRRQRLNRKQRMRQRRHRQREAEAAEQREAEAAEQAAFQPHLRHSKRLRVVVAGEGG